MTEPKRGRGRGAGAPREGHGLTGGGPSIVGTSGAMRARDIGRPRPAQEAAAERDVVLRHAPPAPPKPEVDAT